VQAWYEFGPLFTGGVIFLLNGGSKMDKCFVMQPFDGGPFDKRYDDVFYPAIKDAGLSHTVLIEILQSAFPSMKLSQGSDVQNYV